jgi:hypothetical protein
MTRILAGQQVALGAAATNVIVQPGARWHKIADARQPDRISGEICMIAACIAIQLP